MYTQTKWYQEAIKSKLLESSLFVYDNDEGLRVTLKLALHEAEYLKHAKESEKELDKEYKAITNFINKYSKSK